MRAFFSVSVIICFIYLRDHLLYFKDGWTPELCLNWQSYLHLKCIFMVIRGLREIWWFCLFRKFVKTCKWLLFTDWMHILRIFLLNYRIERGHIGCYKNSAHVISRNSAWKRTSGAMGDNHIHILIICLFDCSIYLHIIHRLM